MIYEQFKFDFYCKKSMSKNKNKKTKNKDTEKIKYSLNSSLKIIKICIFKIIS
jgi:hypothetical protein